MPKNGVSTKRIEAKIVIIGNYDVGKTALMERFVYSSFSSRRMETIGATFTSKEIVRGKESINFAIWDTAGTERYRAMMKQYYRSATGAIICYDVTDRVSWNVLRSWAAEIRHNEPDCQLYICGTKKDLVDEGYAPRAVAFDVIKFYAEGLHAPIIETSSKTGDNVDALFSIIADDLWNRKLPCAVEGSVSIRNEKKSKCCYNS